MSFDGRAFLIDGKRTMIMSGSVHYPRASSAEWPTIIEMAKKNGINMIETYVFWDVHEPNPGEFYFPDDGSSSDLIAFLKECQKQDMYVNVRFGPYVCAEWNYGNYESSYSKEFVGFTSVFVIAFPSGGFPAWLRKIDGMTFRTMNDPFLERMTMFIDKSVQVIKDAKMFAPDNGPVIMVQIENEYGNMEHYYPAGDKYVQWCASYADSLNLNIPWMMCQQGEGTGTAPPAHIINTCNGYYCDNWIEQHALDFPNQPHMWTENWPGWFQLWGQAAPHRPTVDITFAIARWVARGGTFMNYYMLFGGTTFGRKAGGPYIITSYDYDVQINEYALPAEPKFSATRNLHSAFFEVAPIVLAQDTVPAAVYLSSTCESHKYGNSDDELGCVSFLSNYGTSTSCTFNISGVSFEVPKWSVSIVKNTCSSSSLPVLLLNTRQDAVAITPNVLTSNKVSNDKTFSEFSVYRESIPAKLSDPANTVNSASPLEQLDLTVDKTDYLWYSSTISAVPEGVNSVKISYGAGEAGGNVMYAFVNGVLVSSSDPERLVLSSEARATTPQNLVSAAGVPISFQVPVKTGDNSLDILHVSMGLKNYGPYLEKLQAGIVTNVTVEVGSQSSVLSGFTQVIGLEGEGQQLWSSKDDWGKPLSESSDCSEPLSWYKAEFETPSAQASDGSSLPLALNIRNDNTGKSLGKGAIWINGFMLGRYWNIVARSVPACSVCTSEDYAGSYNNDNCRSGCGEMTQRLYKIPGGLLYPSGRYVFFHIVDISLRNCCIKWCEELSCYI